MVYYTVHTTYEEINVVLRVTNTTNTISNESVLAYAKGFTHNTSDSGDWCRCVWIFHSMMHRGPDVLMSSDLPSNVGQGRWYYWLILESQRSRGLASTLPSTASSASWQHHQLAESKQKLAGFPSQHDHQGERRMRICVAVVVRIGGTHYMSRLTYSL